MKQKSPAALLGFLLLLSFPAFAEHPGFHQSKVSESSIQNAITSYINAHKNSGKFIFADRKNKSFHDFTFVRFHPSRRMTQKKMYFACSNFYEGNNPKKVYDLDFWLVERKEGGLAVVDVKIHKDAVQTGKSWSMKKRYNFDGEEIKYL